MEISRLSGGFAAIPIQFNHLPRTPTSTISRCSSSNLTHTHSLPQTDIPEWQSRKRMFILGMGFVGRFFAEELKNHGWFVSGTCTHVTKKKELEERGFNVHLFNANEPGLMILDTLKDYTHLLVSVPPVVGIGDPILKHGELLRSTLSAGHLRWLGYLSSTGVYGHCGGALVNENCPANPATELAILRLAAEEEWLNLGCDLGLSAHVFRLGGIYGPGRSAVDTIIKQSALSEAQKMRRSKQYTSRIHVDDICQALMASVHKLSSWKIFNVVDDDPAPREEVFAFARHLVEKKWPDRLKESRPLEKTEPSDEERSSRAEKQVSNERMKRELGVRLQHPSYKSGLQSIVDQMENPCQNTF